MRFQRGFERRFERFRLGYRELLTLALAHRALFVAGFLAFVAGSFALTPFLGRDFFPSVDAGQILMHARAQRRHARRGDRQQFAEITKAIRQIIPPDEIATIVDNIGMPVSRHQHDLQQHRDDRLGGRRHADQAARRPPADRGLRQLLREELPARFPGVTFSFLPADIVSQILNFGAPAPIDLQVRGPNLQANFAYAQELLRRLRQCRASPMRASSSRSTVRASTSISIARARSMPASRRAT